MQTMLCSICVHIVCDTMLWLDTLLYHLSLFGNDKGGDMGKKYTYTCYSCYTYSLRGEFVHTLFVIFKKG